MAEKRYPVVDIENLSFDQTFLKRVVEVVGFDGQALQRLNADNLADIIQTSGTDTFVGFAAPGTATSTAKWQAFKVNSAGSVTYADGDANFDNVATDLTSLTYS